MLGRFETFTLAISEISQCWNKIAADEMKAYGLKAAHAIYIISLYRNSGVTAAELCEICNKDKADISRSLSVMESSGLILREKTGDNAYRAKIFLTPKGVEAAEQIKQRVILAVQKAGSGLCETEREVFYKSLESILANLKKISKDGLSE